MTNSIADALRGFWPALIAGAAGLSDGFAAEGRISHPPAGDSRGREALAAYLHGTHVWLAGQAARWEPLATTIAASRVVDEGELVLQRDGGELRLPVACVAEGAGGHIGWLRIYHSMWPLEGKHTVRPPLLPAQTGLRLTGAPAAYQDALARHDLEAILATFGPEACAREPSGAPYVYCGPQDLRRLYTTIFAEELDIYLEHCTVTDDGVRCAIEYNVVGRARTPLPPQPGVAVYERGPDGLLAAARIYDDVDVPASK